METGACNQDPGEDGGTRAEGAVQGDQGRDKVDTYDYDYKYDVDVRQEGTGDVSTPVGFVARDEVKGWEPSSGAYARALAEAELLNSIAIATSGEDNLDTILSAALDRLAHLVTFTGGSIALVEGESLVIRAATGRFAQTALGQRLPRGSKTSISWQVIDKCAPFLSEDLLADGYRPSNPIRSYLAVPLVWRGKAFGLLEVDSTEKHAFDQADVSLMQKVAVALSGPVELARRYAAEAQALVESEHAVRMRDELLSVVSHDLKNPLAVIKGSAQLLERHIEEINISPEDAARLTRSVGRIKVVTDKMIMLIGELMDFAQVQVGHSLALYRRPTDLVALARRVAAEHQQVTSRHTISVVCDRPAVSGEWDGFRLERVLDNLVSNAVKFSPYGGPVAVEIRTETGEDGNWAVLAVRDQGMGIAPNDLPHIFEWFRRGGNSLGQATGAGIGLASVRFIVEQHGGSVDVESELGKGTCFTMRLPLAPNVGD